MQLITPKISNSLNETSNDLIIIGSHSFNKCDVYEDSGHFQEQFYKSRITSFHKNYYTISENMRIYRRFKERYPVLKNWFDDDMVARVGRSSVDIDQTFTMRLDYRSRWYIYHLGIFGLKLDYPYLFSIRTIDNFTRLKKRYGIDYGLPEIHAMISKLAYHENGGFAEVRWIYNRLILHTQKKHYSQITLDDLEEAEQAAHDYRERYNKSIFWNHVKLANIYRITASLYRLRMILYTLGIISVAPKKNYRRADIIDRELTHLKYPKIREVIKNYIQQIKRTKEKSTVTGSFKILHGFIQWLETNFPEVTNLNQLTRPMIEKYLDYFKNHISKITGKNYSQSYVSSTLSGLKVFLDESLYFGYTDVPQHKLLFNFDIIKKPRPLPRYIPEKDLNKLMDAVKGLRCPYQRNALILLRWTGARREEIRRLDNNALDYYEDGTAKLYLPVGKTNQARWVPTHQEAKVAYQELIELRKTSGNIKGLPDRKTGQLTDYLFMKKNYLLSAQYLFDKSMREVCEIANLLDDSGKLKYTTHQFRHTIGTQMANKGASLATIMKMLGHQSPDMTIRYAQIFDETVKKDYQCAIGSQNILAGGEYAEKIKRHELNSNEIDWIKNNFHKTYLAMGHCFHHVHEPMCDFVDACYFCPKFVTTKIHLPKLLDKYQVELQLIKDAKNRGWEKEVNRHENVAARVKYIIGSLEKNEAN